MKQIKSNDLDLVERLKLEDEFFSKEFLMSYSGLSKLNYSPGAFYLHYVLKQRDDVMNKPMIEGSLIHCMLLTPEKFNEQFVVLPDAFPSDNPKKVIDRLSKHIQIVYPEIVDTKESILPYLENVQNAIIDILKDENLYQSLKTDAQRLDKILTEKNMEYLQFLLQCKDKMVVEYGMVEFAEKIREQIMSNDTIRNLMGFNDKSTQKSYNELEVVAFPDEYTFGLRGIIDNLVIDHQDKVIRVNDLKKTSKAASAFQESIDYYQYWLQAAIYNMIINNIKQSSFNVDYPVEFRFIVVDPYLHVVPFLVSEVTMSRFTEMTKDSLHIANHHFIHKDFSAPFGVMISTNNEIII